MDRRAFLTSIVLIAPVARYASAQTVMKVFRVDLTHHNVLRAATFRSEAPKGGTQKRGCRREQTIFVRPFLHCPRALAQRGNCVHVPARQRNARLHGYACDC